MAIPTIPVLAVAGALLGVPAVLAVHHADNPKHIYIDIKRTIDLDRPGALDAVAQANPEHHRKLVGIIEAASDVDCREMPKMLAVKYGALGSCTAPHMLLTSLPPKRHLSFTIDDTEYVVNVALRGEPAKMVPAGEP
ncbi:MAG: hypothetical protein ACXWG1_00225 [Usitatibacter sp.]